VEEICTIGPPMPFADANGHRLYHEITGQTSKPKPRRAYVW